MLAPADMPGLPLPPLLCAALGLIALIVMIARFKVNAFIALMLAALFVGLLAGLPPVAAVTAFGGGLGATLGSVSIVIGLGTMLGRLLAASGGATVVAQTLIRVF